MTGIWKKRKILLLGVLLLALLGCCTVGCINGYVKKVGAARIISPEQAAELEDVDCILVFGCQVLGDGDPSLMLAERINCGIGLYEAGAAPKLLMSGDHGQVEYDEVNTMKRKAVEAGIPSSDVFMDHAGFSTYETIVRARDVFAVEKAILVTQEYHLCRALYIAEKMGLDAYGVASDTQTYAGQALRENREILARCKDFVSVLLQPEPTFLGEVIPVSGDGDRTND